MTLPILEAVDPWYAASVGAAVIALVVAIVVARDAYLDLLYVRRLGIGNGRLRIAKTELRFEIARTSMVALLTVTASAAAFLRADDLAHGPVPLLELAPRIGLLGAFVVIVWDGLEALRYRAWLRSSYVPPRDAPASLADDEEA